MSKAGPDDGAHGRPAGDVESPPWERPDLPSWWTAATGPTMPPSSPARPHGLLVAAVVTVVVVLAAGGGILLVARSRASEQVPVDVTTNALGQANSTVPGTAPPSTAPGAVSGSDTIARLERVQEQVARVRGLQFEREVRIELVSADELDKQVRRQVEKETDEAEVRATARAFAVLGQLPPGTDLISLLEEVQAESVLGYYVPGDSRQAGRGRLYVRAGRGLTPYAEFLLSHELTHALTDQHYDLTRVEKLEAAGHGDQLLGYLSLVEGDATFTMQRFLYQELSGNERTSAYHEGTAERTPVLDAAPPVIKQALGFPYQAGLVFVTTLHQRGGWEAVNRAYADPPTSSEQILHPEKYLSPRDEPQDMKVPDLRKALGGGWKAGVDAEWGEADARFLLTEEVPVTAAKDAAEGWDGGQLRTFERGDRTALALRTVWDSEEEATEFCETMARWATSRLGQPRAEGRWAGDGQHGALLCAGDRVTWLAAPDATTLQRLRGGFDGKP